MATAYDWIAERIDEHGDVQESVADASLDSLTIRNAVKDGWALGLVRDYSRDFDTEGTESREWAYPVDGKLPEFFDGGSKVPQRFHAEWKRHNA